MLPAVIVYLRDLLARTLRPEYERAKAEQAARMRTFYAWRKDPPAFINQMRDADEVVRWLKEQVDAAMSEWQRMGGEFHELIRGVEASRFSEELSPLIRDLKYYRQDPLRKKDPLRSWTSKT